MNQFINESGYENTMSQDFTFTLRRTPFDESYSPSDNTRITTNFANLARGEKRHENLRNALGMINNRFNALASWDNPAGDRYAVRLEIISVDLDIEGNGTTFPAIEILNTSILDRTTGKVIEGIAGNNFSSYVRDYDFSVLLPEHNRNRPRFDIPENFGDLHGKLFRHFVNSDAYKRNFAKPPVICLSVSDNKTYRRTENRHPVLGAEYRPNESSPTESYFKKMGLQVRYFMPPDAVAPLAFYFFGDLPADYGNLELIGTISTMETFQRIYRPEIYNANAAAGACYKPNLKNPDHSVTRIVYDREERSRLAAEQGRFAGECFITPHRAVLEQWAADFAI